MHDAPDGEKPTFSMKKKTKKITVIEKRNYRADRKQTKLKRKITTKANSNVIATQQNQPDWPPVNHEMDTSPAATVHKVNVKSNNYQQNNKNTFKQTTHQLWLRQCSVSSGKGTGNTNQYTQGYNTRDTSS